MGRMGRGRRSAVHLTIRGEPFDALRRALSNHQQVACAVRTICHSHGSCTKGRQSATNQRLGGVGTAQRTLRLMRTGTCLLLRTAQRAIMSE